MKDFGNPEQPDIHSEVIPHMKTREKKETSGRFLKGVELHVGSVIGNIEVLGREHLSDIPADAKVVIVVSHISDYDLPIAIQTLGHDFDIVVTTQSTNLNFTENPSGFITSKIAGTDNFLPVDYTKTKEGKAAEFNPDNFVPMADALEHGKEIVIAAHNPTTNGVLGGGSVGPIYLSQISGALILPVAVNLKTDEALGIDGINKMKTMIQRPDAQVYIGKPLHLESIDGIENIKKLMDKRESGEKLSVEERAQFHDAVLALRSQSDIVMQELAAMLPESKRGKYKDA